MGKMNLEEISRVQFKNLEDINFGEAMKAVSTFNQKLSFLPIIKRLVSIIIKNDYDMKRYGLGKVVFVFSNSYSERKTYRIIFEKVMKLVPDRTEILSKKKIHFDWNRLSSLGLFCVWYHQLRKSKMSVFDKLNVCSYLLQGYCDSEAVLKSIQKHETALVVTFCDVHMIDYIITKRCNDLGDRKSVV